MFLFLVASFCKSTSSYRYLFFLVVMINFIKQSDLRWDCIKIIHSMSKDSLRNCIHYFVRAIIRPLDDEWLVCTYKNICSMRQTFLIEPTVKKIVFTTCNTLLVINFWHATTYAVLYVVRYISSWRSWHMGIDSVTNQSPLIRLVRNQSTARVQNSDKC